MAAFGDDDPEDRWDAGDPITDRVEILARVVLSLRHEQDQVGDTPRVMRRRSDGLDRAAELLATPNVPGYLIWLLWLISADLEAI